MWFRAEISKDGSIAKLEQVDGAYKNSARVLYIEADNKSQAAERVLAVYRKNQIAQARARQNYRDQKRRAGLCTECGKVPPRPGLRACRECGERKHRPAQSQRQQRSELERAAAYVARDRAKAAARRAAAKEVGETNSSLCIVQHEMDVLLAALAAFDRKDRDWFVAQIEARRARLNRFRSVAGVAKEQPVAAE